MFLKFVFQYRDRLTGQMITEQLSYPKLQKWVIRSRFLWRVLDGLLNTRLFCLLYGKWVDRSASIQDIKPFIEKFKINLDEVEKPLREYLNFNAFFSRKLKTNTRPFDQNLTTLCAPADGKILVYPQLTERTQLPIKHAHVDIKALLKSETRAEPYYGGAALVLRLAPYDYHRYHFPTAGVATPAEEIAGRYYLVNPMALSVKPDLFAHNKRMISFLNTEQFGRIAYIEVAGFAVGRIIQTYTPGPVKRGQEKGYFQFGGSTLVLLFEPTRLIFDHDLVTDTEAGIEVQVKTGTQIATQRI